MTKQSKSTCPISTDPHENSQDRAGNDNSGEQVCHQTDDQGDGKTAHRACAKGRAEEVDDERYDDGRDVRVSDRGPGSGKAKLNCFFTSATRPQFFFDTLEDQNVTVNCRTHRY